LLKEKKLQKYSISPHINSVVATPDSPIIDRKIGKRITNVGQFDTVAQTDKTLLCGHKMITVEDNRTKPIKK